MGEALTEVLSFLLFIMGICLVLAVIGLAAIAQSIRKLQVPRDADFFTTMHYVPLSLMIMLDMLDFALDIFAAPISWIVLDRMGLPNLRNKAAVEALIPFTGPIPTFTIAWFLARFLDVGGTPGNQHVERSSRYLPEEPYHSRRDLRQRRPPTRIIDMDDR
jgi:hypothetical protein